MKQLNIDVISLCLNIQVVIIKANMVQILVKLKLNLKGLNFGQIRFFFLSMDESVESTDELHEDFSAMQRAARESYNTIDRLNSQRYYRIDLSNIIVRNMKQFFLFLKMNCIYLLKGVQKPLAVILSRQLSDVSKDTIQQEFKNSEGRGFRMLLTLEEEPKAAPMDENDY